MTGTSIGNYFYLNGGYLQGFFKLYDYNYELLPPRYNNGITIETILEILPQSEGIFFYMGTRAEDKYNSYFSGETAITGITNIAYGGNHLTGYTYQYSGITTSENNYLVSFDEKNEKYSGFKQPEYSDVVILDDITQINNIGNNIISFEITDEKRLKYKYVNANGDLIQNESPNQINKLGWTIIDIVYKPYNIISNYNSLNYACYSRRKGDLIFYINGGKFWKISDFDEFYFKEINTDKEKQIGVPFNISWGGGSFGLKHSWHYDNFNKNTIIQDDQKNNLFVEKYFNDSYIGNVQKLRVYNTALLSTEILHNANIEAMNTSGYDISISKGGRIISQCNNTQSISQQTSGSDIRKSIKYRNSDGSYKNLYEMIDIMVVIKSRSNPNIELVKFKKVGGSGWIPLIYININTYDFIVPNSITSLHPNEILFSEIKFQWADPNDIDGVFDRIMVSNITTRNLLNNTVKNY